MPLSVEIKVNGRLIETIHVGRMESLKGKTRAHEYKVWVEREPEAVAYFMHYYDEGARVCVANAMGALERMRKKKRE